MNRSGFTTRTPAAAMLAAAAASGLVLAGCGNSTTATTASASSSASGQPAGSGSSPAGTSNAGANSASSNGASSDGSGTVTAGTALFPLAVGNTWVYQEKLSGDSGTVTNKVISVSPAAGGNKVAMKVKDDLLGVHTGSTSVFIVHSDGSISVPVAQVGSTSVTVKSGSIIWPSSAQLESGQPHHDTLVISIKEDGHASTVTAHVVVKGEGTQTVRVPAGTYQATLINETMDEKFSGINVGLDIRTWVANGVGPVKSEVSSNAAGRTAIATLQELKSFTKG
jgi:hypothetical protein